MATAFQRREPDDHRVRRQAASAAFAVCGGFAAIFVFFAGMGAIDVSDAIVLTIVAIVFGLVWFSGFMYRQVTQATRTQWRDRERRGF
jgi:fatty acid desaturase